jgi:arabinogalactan endo-1,4-beta-galactosidase
LVCFLQSLHSFSQPFYLGADLSYVNEMDDCGAIYYDNGVVTDAYQIFEKHGANLARIRLWHDPDSVSGYSFLNDVKRSIARAKDQRMQVLLDFHYSDIWADPGRQWAPRAWNNIKSDSVMADSVYQYTNNTLEELRRLDLLPDLIQIGNETNGNILQTITTDDLRDQSPNNFPIDWTRQVLLLNAGIKVVRDFNTAYSTSMKTILHIAQPENLEWWMDEAFANGIDDFDIIGFSYYPRWSDFDIREVASTVERLRSKYSQDIMMVEVAYKWSGINNELETRPSVHSKIDLKDFLIELTYLLKEAGAVGIIYWEPAWVDTDCQTLWGTGSSADSQIFFDSGNQLHEAIEWLSYDYQIIPEALKPKIVSFSIDMLGHSNTDKVFITGDISGTTDWKFVELTKAEDQVYSTDIQIPGRSRGAYIFYSDNNWDEKNRETVPQECAKFLDSYRKYVVKSAPIDYSFAWSECDDTPDSPVLTLEQNRDIIIYPNPASSRISFRNPESITDIEVYDLNGRLRLSQPLNENEIFIDDFNPGLYFLNLEFKNGTFETFKLIIE